MVPDSRRRDQFIDRRKHLGHTQESLAYALEVSVSSIAQWERGITTPTPRHRRKLAAMLEVGLHDLDVLLDPDGEPVEAVGHAVPLWLDHLTSLEQAAGEFRSVELTVMPGLLQTRAYAEAVMRANYRPLSEEHITSRVEARLARQAVFDREPEPLRFRTFIDESVLLRTTGSSQVMIQQFDHLLAMAERPAVEFRILPLNGITHCTGFGSFYLLVKQGATKPFMVCTENVSSVRFEEYAGIVDDHVMLFQHLEAVAMSPAQSRDCVHQARSRYR